MTNDDGTVEVTHDALIKSWDQLKTWLDNNRDDLRAPPTPYRRLTGVVRDLP